MIPATVRRPSSAERPAWKRLLQSAEDAKRNPGTPFTVIGSFVTSWPSMISNGQLEGFESGRWIAKGKDRQQMDGRWRLPAITLTYAADEATTGGALAGVIAAVELLLEELRTLDGAQ